MTDLDSVSRDQVAPEPPSPVSLREALRFWLKLGFIGFGGPAGQIAIMHQELVERRRWISERRFLHALNYCMLLPGPEAQQLATYLGWLMHRTRGGILAGALFVLPSLFILIALSWVYIAFGHVGLVAGLFYGIKPAVTAIVLHAAHRIGTRALKNRVLWAIAAAAFVAIFALGLPFPLIVAGAALVGVVGGRFAPRYFRTGGGHGAATASFGPALIDDDTPPAAHVRFRWSGLLRVVLVGALLWLAPMAVLTVGLRLGTHADADGLVLHQGGAADLRRRLRGAALRVPGRGAALRLAHAGADDRRARARRDHAGAADHGGGLRRLRRRLRAGAVRPAGAVPCRRAGRVPGHLVHLPAVVPVHPRRRAAGGVDARRPEVHRTAHRDHRGRGRRDAEPRAVLRLPRAVAAGFRRRLRLGLRADRARLPRSRCSASSAA